MLRSHSHGWRHKINRLYWLTQFKDILHNVESKDDLNDYNYKKTLQYNGEKIPKLHGFWKVNGN